MSELATKFCFFQSYYPHLALAAAWGLKTSAILVLALAVTAFLKGRSARARCWIWRLSFVGLAALLAFEFGPRILQRARPKIALSVADDAAMSFWKDATAARLIRSSEEMGRIVEERRKELASPARLKPPWEGEEVPQTTMQDLRREPWSILEAAVPSVWGAGLVISLLLRGFQTVLGFFWLRRKSRAAEEELMQAALAAAAAMSGKACHPVVRVSSSLASPLMFGFFRSLIYLPEAARGWDKEKLAMVFLHELAHWTRKDFAWFQFGRVMLALFWWNPLAGMALRRMGAEAEEAADDEVILRKTNAPAYAQTLVEIAADDPAAGGQAGVSMLGYRSLEKRIRSLLRENRWRSKLGKLAGGTLVLFAVVMALFSSIYLGMASPGQPSLESLTTAQKRTLQRIVENTKRRLQAFRYVHARLESDVSLEAKGKIARSSVPARLEIWNDSWTNVHRVEYRPQLTQSTSGSPFFISDMNDLCDGTKSYYYQADDPVDEIRAGTARPMYAMYGDYLGLQAAKDLIQLLENRVEVSVTKTADASFAIEEIEWQGNKALRMQEKFFRDGKVYQQRTFVVIPGKKDALQFSEMAFSEHPEASRWWTVDEIGMASNGEFYPIRFTAVSSPYFTSMTTSKSTVSVFEPLAGLPPGIGKLPESPETKYLAKGGKVIPRTQLVINCVEPASGNPVPEARVAVRINGQASQEMRANGEGTLAIPLPREEVTSLDLKISKPGFAPRMVSWRKYGDPIQLPESYQVSLFAGSPISGKVVDEAGRSLSGATVEMFLTGGPRTWSIFGDRFALGGKEAKTNEHGEWSLPDFPEDLSGLCYRVSCSGYRATTDSGIADFRQDSGLSYASLRDGSAVIALQKGIELAGRITDASGTPISKCRLTIRRDIRESAGPVAESNAAGEYSLKGLSAGKAWVTAESALHRPVAREIDLPWKGPLDFVLQPGRVIRGRVTMPDGAPCAGLNVSVDKWNGLRTLNFGTQTDAEGNFIWKGAPDDAVEFVFGACQGREFLAGLWLKPEDAMQSIVMKPALRFSGGVVDAETGRAVSSFALTPGRWREAGDIFWESDQTRTFQTGQFDWETRRMGDSYVFKIEAPGYAAYQTQKLAAGQNEAMEVIRLNRE